MIIIENVGSCRIHPPVRGPDGLAQYDIEVLALNNTQDGGLIGSVSVAGLQSVLAISLMHLSQFRQSGQEMYQKLDGAFFDLMDKQGPNQETTIDVSKDPVMFTLRAKDFLGKELVVGPTSEYFEITKKMDELAADLKQRRAR